mgnify:CR=1 FL=1|tara:strand:- start:13417 stop:13671 length:255 start_codon:yes stop_codon:yes gene_type:complete
MKKKTAPRTKDADIQRIVNEIYAQLNAIIEQINTIGDGVKSVDSKGVEGQLRMKLVDNNVIHLECRTKKGWKTAKVGDINVKFE